MNFTINSQFTFLADTADGIAGELISAGLVDVKDFVAVAQNLQRLIIERAKMKSVIFPLVCANFHLDLYFF